MPIGGGSGGISITPIYGRASLADGAEYTFTVNGLIVLYNVLVSGYFMVTGDGTNWNNIASDPGMTNFSLITANKVKWHNATGGAFTYNYAGWKLG